MSARGGKREGAGRKPGSATRKTREIADRAAAEGITPLEVMLANMRRWWTEQDWDKAQSAAVDAAAFMHPKMSAIDHTSNGESMTAVYSGVPRADDTDKSKTSHH